MAIGDKIFVASQPSLDAFEAKFDSLLNGDYFLSYQQNTNHAANTVLDISGKGIVHFIYNSGGSAAQTVFQIDGGVHQSIALMSNNCVTLLMPFETSLKVSTGISNISSLVVSYKLI